MGLPRSLFTDWRRRLSTRLVIEPVEARQLLASGVWSQVSKLQPIDIQPSDNFAFSVAIDSNVSVVGSYLDDDNGDDSGSAYVFNVTTGSQIAKLKPTDGATSDWFGISVAVSGNLALIGSPRDDDAGADSGSAYVFNISTGQQIAKLKPADGAAGDWFGHTLVLNGTTAVIGSYRDDDNGTDSGSAYVFNVGTGKQIAKLKAADGSAGDRFGGSLSLSGGAVLVGSSQDDDNGFDSGSAYLFNAASGQQISKLKPADGDEFDYFGASVAMSGNLAVVGSPYDDDAGGSSGSAYVFDTSTGQQIVKLNPTDGAPDDEFGAAVALLGDTALIGSRNDDDNGSNTGSAYVFNASAGQQLAKLKPANGQTQTSFGMSVALSGNVALIGAGFSLGSAFVFRTLGPEVQVTGNGVVITDGDLSPSPDDDSDFGKVSVGSSVTRTFAVRNSGSATTSLNGLTVPFGFSITDGLSASLAPGAQDTFSVRLDGNAGGTFGGEVSFTVGSLNENPFNFAIRGVVQAPWPQVAKLTANDGAAGDNFGNSLALRGNTAIIGSPNDNDGGRVSSGSAYLVNATSGAQIVKLAAADPGSFDNFGISVALNDNVALVGSWRDDDNGTDSGSAYLFNATTGQQIAKLKPADGAAGDRFGYSVALSGNVAIVGSFLDDDNGVDSGSAYLFNVTTGQQIAKLKPTDGAAQDNFGVSVALSGNLALVGSWYDDDDGSSSGSAYVFNATTGQQIAKLKAPDAAAFDSLGYSVALSGSVALVGSLYDDDNGLDSGSAYLFNATTGQQIAKVKPTDGAAQDNFGVSVALSGEYALVGSSLDRDSGVGTGSAYLFDASTGRQLSKLTANDGAAEDYFGISVALSGDTALIGGPGDDDKGAASGSTYRFQLDAVAPQVESNAFSVAQGQQFTVSFSEVMRPDVTNLSGVTAIRTGQSSGVSPTSVTWSANNTRATFNFTGLTDGSYQFRIAAGAVADASGNVMATASLYAGQDAFVYAGDANRDRKVDFDDLLVLAANYNAAGRTFTEGNFNYDGVVNFDDLLMLASRYNVALTGAQAAAVAMLGMPLVSRVPRPDDNEISDSPSESVLA